MRRAILLVAAAAVLALAGCGGGASASSGGAWAGEKAERSSSNASLSAALDPSQHAKGAYDRCVQRITDQLKAPATAEFSSRDSSHQQIQGSHLQFSGTVDSENSFGALIRSDWSCDVLWTGSGYVVEKAVVTSP